MHTIEQDKCVQKQYEYNILTCIIMSNGFNPLSLFKPTGNPVVLKLLQNRQTPLNDLLDQQSFPTEFRRDGNEILQKYMTYKKYLTLVQYVTEVGDQTDKNRAYKYPFVAAEILSIDNSHTFKYFISSKPIIEQQVIIEEVEIQQQIDSDRSFMSQISQGSIVSDESQAERDSIDNKDSNQQFQQQMPDVEFQKTPSEINEDDFPFIQEIKKVKIIKKKVQKVINHQYPPLINNLLQYFNKPLNHTLAGYVCKVISALLSRNPTVYSSLLLKAQSTLFLTHIESRSVEQLLVKILTYETESESDVTLQYNLLMLCLYKLFDDGQKLVQINLIQVVQDLSFLLCEVIEKISQGEIKSKHFQNLIKEIIKSTFFDKLCDYFQQTVKLLQEFMSQNDLVEIEIAETRIKEFSKIASTFLQMVLKVKQNQDFKQDYISVSNRFEDSINQLTQSAYHKLELQAVESKKMNFKNRFGMTKILLINIFFTLIKQNMGFCQQILAEKQFFFEILLQIVHKSPLNNILHNSVFSIFNFFVEGLKKNTSNEDKVITGSLFRQVFDIDSKYSFLHFCVQTFRENESLPITQKKGYTGHLIKICSQLHNIASSKDDELIRKLKSTPEWQYIISHHVDPFTERTKKNLGSYIKRRDIKASIQFDKSIILENHKQFLKGTKFTTLDEFENFDEEESDSEEERHHHAGHVSVSKETEHEIQEMEREEFEMNSGIKKDFNAGLSTKSTVDSIKSSK